VYVPSKEHIYWSRIWDPTDVNNILERSVTVKLSEGDHGHFEWEPTYLSYDTFNANHNAQEKLLTDFAQSSGIQFLNLTPIFWEQGIKRGELYHYADPHWNQAGNDLAAQTIAEYIKTHRAVSDHYISRRRHPCAWRNPETLSASSKNDRHLGIVSRPSPVPRHQAARGTCLPEAADDSFRPGGCTQTVPVDEGCEQAVQLFGSPVSWRICC
jgi:hypothetical protein